MLYSLLTVEQLRDVARRYGVSPTGTKETLITRLEDFERDFATAGTGNTDSHDDSGEQHTDNTNSHDNSDDQHIPPLPSDNNDNMAATPPATTPADIWRMYSPAQINNMVAGQGFDMTHLITTDDKIAALARIPGLTPANAIAAFNAMPRDQQPKIVTTLDKQASSEPADQFLQRVRAHFDLIPHSNEQAINALLQAASDKLRTFIHAQRQDGVQDIGTMLTRLETKYTPNAYQYYDLYTAYKMPSGHTAQEAGTELRRLFIQFTGYTPAQVRTNEALITKVLAGRFLQVLPANVAAMLRTYLLENADRTWDEILDKANQLMPSNTTRQRTTAGTGRNNKYCSVHGYRGHSDAECYAQHGAPSDKSQTPKKATPVKCYACYKYGHTARDCPNQPSTGNDNTGSP
ncbi:MAG: hypothetical protein NHG36_15415 [Chromatiaceae bacterium]|nr:hypothetical protein [Candidatus Thioaporhodococcus sediminis]